MGRGESQHDTQTRPRSAQPYDVVFEDLLDGHVDAADIEARVAQAVAVADPDKLSNEEKLALLTQAVTMVDLTTLEGSDTPEKVKELCLRAKGVGAKPPRQ